MSLLKELTVVPGSTHYQKRVGRGKGSGLGQTAGRGGKGQTARTGGKVRRGFEGGQMPLHRRMPKVGFNNPFGTDYNIVNLKDLTTLSGEISPETLKQAGLVKGNRPLKVLGEGEVKSALTVKAHKFSAKAKSAIEAAGGKAEVIN